MEWLNEHLANIIIAVIAASPALLAYHNSRKTRTSIALMGSDVTVKNWNSLIQNLYTEIRRLTNALDTERTYSKGLERKLRDALKEVEDLRFQLRKLERRIKDSLE